MAVFGEAHFSFFPPPLPPLRPDADSPPWQGCSFWGGGGPEGGGGRSVGQPQLPLPEKGPFNFRRAVGRERGKEGRTRLVDRGNDRGNGLFPLSLRAKLKRRGGEETYVGVQLRFWGGVKKGKLLWNFCEKKCKRRFPRHFFGGEFTRCCFPSTFLHQPARGIKQTRSSRTKRRRGGGRGNLYIFPANMHSPPAAFEMLTKIRASGKIRRGGRRLFQTESTSLLLLLLSPRRLPRPTQGLLEHSIVIRISGPCVCAHAPPHAP